MTILTFSAVIRRSTALTRILTLVARLGGDVTYLSAVERRATLVVRAPRRAAHRFAPQLRKIIDVIELIELRRIGDEIEEGKKQVKAPRSVRGVA